MKSKFLKGLVGISMLATTGLVAEELSNTSYYDCGYDETAKSKCFLYMPSGTGTLATHTAGTLTDYKQVSGVQATFKDGVLTLPATISSDLPDASKLAGRSDVVDFYYIQQNVKGADGKPMFYLYNPNSKYLAQHEAGKMGAANVTTIPEKVTSGEFAFNVTSGVATVTTPATTPTPTPTATPADDMSILVPPSSGIALP